MILGLAFLLAALLSSCFLPDGQISNYENSSFASNGERIFFTATSSSGQPIRYSGGVAMMHQRTACANCHGPDGRGGSVNMMMWRFDIPDITWVNLTQGEHAEDDSAEGEHEEHPPYTEETLRRTITGGLDPAGQPLDRRMPRWQMLERDLDDLVDFIKTLK